MSDATATPSKFGIVNRIAAILKLGDFGKIENFITKVEATLNKEISTLERNLSNEKFNSDNRIKDLEEKLEDRKADLADSYLAIDPKNVSNNEAAKSFIDTYLGNITEHQTVVSTIEDAIADEKTAFKDAKKVTEEKIAKRKEIIASVTGK